MKSLLILRHGKAEAFNESSDKSRVLAERGIRDAKKMGELILEKTGTPDLIVSSDAARARQTAEIASKAAHYKAAIDFRPEIYNASMGRLIQVVESLPESAKTVLIVGHNPGLFDLAGYLINGNLESELPTCGLVHLHVPVKWDEAIIGTAKLVGEYIPKNL